MSRTGRRPGGSAAREEILAAARALFAEVGYERASIRAIARRAGVDPALVHHYFGTKDDLLGAAIELPIDPQRVLGPAFADPSTVGEAFARAFLSIWEDPQTRDRALALVRAAVTNAAAAAILRDVITRSALRPISVRISAPDAELRAEVAASHMIGLAIARYVVHLEPLASASVDDLVAIVGPSLQRYLVEG